MSCKYRISSRTLVATEPTARNRNHPNIQLGILEDGVSDRQCIMGLTYPSYSSSHHLYTDKAFVLLHHDISRANRELPITHHVGANVTLL